MKKKPWKIPIPIIIAAAIVLLSGGILIYALTKTTEKAGPVGYWKFDEGAGTVAYDASGNANNGTLTSFDFDDDSNWTTGKVAGALKFDGSDDYIKVSTTTNSVLNITDEITIEAWIKPATDTGEHAIVVKFRDDVLKDVPYAFYQIDRKITSGYQGEGRCASTPN